MPRSASLRLIVLVPSLLVLAACTREQFQSLRNGQPNFNTALLLPSVSGKPIESRNASTLQPALPAELSQLSGIDTLTTDCPGQASSDQATINTCIYALKRIIDDAYREYRITLHSLASGGNAALDIAGLAFSTAATASPANAAKTLLAALATSALGLKTALNEDLLYKQAIETVLNQMDSDRDKQFAIMLSQMNAGLQLGGPTYTMGAAKDDLLSYFEAGTFDHGLTSLQVTAAANRANCQAQLDNTKVAIGALGTAAGEAARAATGALSSGAGCAAPPGKPVSGAGS